MAFAPGDDSQKWVTVNYFAMDARGQGTHGNAVLSLMKMFVCQRMSLKL